MIGTVTGIVGVAVTITGHWFVIVAGAIFSLRFHHRLRLVVGNLLVVGLGYILGADLLWRWCRGYILCDHRLRIAAGRLSHNWWCHIIDSLWLFLTEASQLVRALPAS